MRPTLRQAAIDTAWAFAIAVAIAAVQAAPLELTGGIAPVWIGGGVTAGILGALPRHRWGPYLAVLGIASTAFYVMTDWGLPLALLRVLVDIVVVALVAMALQRTRCLPPRELRDAVTLAIIGTIAALVRFVAMGVSVLLTPGRFEDPLSATTNVYLNTVLAILAITPVAYLIVSGGFTDALRSARIRQRVVLLLVMAFTLVISFIASPLADLPGSQYLVFPVLIYAALTVGPLMAAVLVAVTVLVVTAATVTLRGPFVLDQAIVGSQERAILQAQSLLLLLTASVWLLLSMRASEATRRRELERLVDTDEVTGLRSRVFVTQYLDDALVAAERDGTHVGVMFVDLGEFLVVNRSLGYEAGDEVLAHLARAVEGEAPAGSVVGRFDGHHLVVVVPEVSAQDEMQAAAQRILDAVAKDTEVHGHRLSRTGSIGIAVSEPGATSTTLLRDADEALVPAKAEGRSRVHVSTSSRSATGADELELEHQLGVALDERQFVLQYQPQIDLATGLTCGYEALVRWQHPVRGLLAPSEFMSTMESSGLVIRLGRQVVEMACANLRASAELPGPVSINVSAIEFAEADWLNTVLRTLHDYDIPPTAVVVEMTETTILHLTNDARRSLTGLRDVGIGVHIDDFGTGYASVGALRGVPVTGLKLDRSFVSPVTCTDSEQFGLIRGIAALADGLGLEKIAEGIETSLQAELVAAAGWSVGQGYLFGPPTPALLGAPGSAVIVDA